MITLNNEKYPSEFVKAALEAYYQAGNDPSQYDDSDDNVGFTIETEKGTLSVYSMGNDYRSVFVDLLANEKQCMELRASKDIPEVNGIRSLLLATIEVPDNSAKAKQAAGMVENCPRIFLYEGFYDDDVSHSIFMDGDRVVIRR